MLGDYYTLLEPGLQNINPALHAWRQVDAADGRLLRAVVTSNDYVLRRSFPPIVYPIQIILDLG